MHGCTKAGWRSGCGIFGEFNNMKFSVSLKSFANIFEVGTFAINGGFGAKLDLKIRVRKVIDFLDRQKQQRQGQGREQR